MKSDSATSSLANRRSFLQGSAMTLAAGAAVAAGGGSDAVAAPVPERIPPTRQPVFVTVETSYGKVQGINNVGINSFWGIPYGAPTNGKGRYMPPRNPQPWAGVRECMGFAGICPQPARGGNTTAQGRMGEDCLNLNVWSPGLDNKKRAVMVTFQGGGWDTGSANGTDGADLARFGDVVVVTVSLRIASQGFLNLADLGAPPEFAFSGVCGVMDMTHALKWVRDNISNFGGDPSRVMIFGCSGGGWRVSTMLGVPAAKGLFHRAAIQSGSTLRLMSRDVGAQRAAAMLAKLGISRSNVADIQKVSWQQLLAAQIATVEEGAYYSPVLDGVYLPHDPFFPTAPPESKDVAIMVSTTLDDAGLYDRFYDNSALNDGEVIRRLDQRFEGRGKEIVAFYRKFYPSKSSFLLLAMIMTDASNRQNAVAQVELKTAQGGAPAYLYQWDWVTAREDGRGGATHGDDMAAALHNVSAASLGGGSAAGTLMADRLSSAWVAFAKTGDPNNPRIPPWEPYNPRTRPTMVFNDDTRLEFDPRSEMRKYWPTSPDGKALKRGVDGVPRVVSTL